MDIKEIALKLLAKEFPGMRQENQTFMVEFAEALISAYKAKLQKEVGEPVAVTNHAQLGYVTDGMHPDIPLAMWAKETSYSGANVALYTSDQVAAAILKATGPLEELGFAMDQVRNRCQLVTRPDGVTIFVMDGQPMLEIQPLSSTMDGNVITVTRNIKRLYGTEEKTNP